MVITSAFQAEDVGSIPITCSIIWESRIVAIAADCNSAASGLRWFESNLSHHTVSFSGLCHNLYCKYPKRCTSERSRIGNADDRQERLST